ncbi:hypothetical protein ACIO1C_29800 [Streptomyces sp. NPDC087420]|uniref:hypothetical protein n=1 Tax=Streptomyces sp. NPDC087420 TaxID=3365785 RepID=UPI0038341656
MTIERERPVRDELVPENSRFHLPSVPSIITVTPDMASDWVSYRNHPLNRPLSAAVTAKYQADMTGGRFREATPEGYIFDTTGRIISGQHRMKAQANGNVTLRMWIFPGEPRDIFEVVDQGYKRTAAHVLRVPYATSLAAASRHLAALTDNDPWGMPRFPKITTPEIVATFHAWPELTRFGASGHACWREAGIPAGPHLAALAQATRTEYAPDISTWIEGVHTGAGLEAGDPRLLLRRRFHVGLASDKGRRDHAYALVVKAWNAHVQGESLNVLSWRSTERLPRVIGFEFGKGEA